MTGKRVAVVVGAALLALGLVQPSASAGPTATHGRDIAWTDGGVRIWVRDNEADNHGVYAQYITRRGGVYQVGDPDGSAGGPGTELSEDGTVIESWRVCEHTEGCGNWV